MSMFVHVRQYIVESILVFTLTHYRGFPGFLLGDLMLLQSLAFVSWYLGYSLVEYLLHLLEAHMKQVC